MEDTGGYIYRFVDQLHEQYICIICHHPSRDPYMTGECCQGQTVCKSCLDLAVDMFNSCPFCRSEENFHTYPNWRFKREINNLHIYCTNEEKGCRWKGELHTINNHLGNNDGCKFEEVYCSNECGKMIQRQYLTGHVETECPHRQVNCQYCRDTGEHQFIEGQHKEECPKLPLPCPNKCEVGTVPREDMEKHREECQLEIINCSNDCGEKLERQSLTNHLETKCPCRKVDCQYCHDTGEHQFIEGQHKEECVKFPLRCPNNCEEETIPREDMEVHRKECPLEIIQCKYHGVGCDAWMTRKDQEKHEDDEMQEHLMKTTSMLTDVKSELDNTNMNLSITELDLTNTKHELTNTKRELTATQIKLTDMNDQLANVVQHMRKMEISMYLATDRVATYPASSAAIMNNSAISWPTKLAAMAVMSKSGDQECPVIVKINEFNKQKEDNICYSDSFYTHNKGYKMCLGVYVTGHGKGTHLSCFLYLLKGLHDNQLIWPLRGIFNIQLLNQINGHQHHSMAVAYDDYTSNSCAARATVEYQNEGWGIRQFISNRDLYRNIYSCQYLKDNSLFFCINFKA